MTYECIYDRKGEVSGIRRMTDSASIPICDGNADFQDFLKWNKTGKLDYKTPIEPQPQEPVETLEEKIRKIAIEEIKKDKLK